MAAHHFRNLTVQTVVTHVRFCESLYTALEINMPIHVSTAGGKSGMASTPEKEDATASKGARSKEDAD